MFICGAKVFESFELANAYFNYMYKSQGIILGIEKVE